jgi:hypothetical protein
VSIHGRTSGAATFNLAADRTVLDQFTVPAGLLVKLTARLDGLGPGVGAQELRGVVYRATGQLLAVSEPVTVADGAAAAWVDFVLGGVAWEGGGDLRLGLQCGPVSTAARVHGTAGEGAAFTDSYADGPVATMPGTSAAEGPAVFVTLATPFVPQERPSDEDLARLPFRTAQRQLVGVVTQDRWNATAEWHGTREDPDRGSFALVREDGDLGELVGERLRVSRAGRSVYVVVKGSAELDEDLSLTRRAFLELGPLAADSLPVRVEVVA